MSLATGGIQRLGGASLRSVSGWEDTETIVVGDRRMRVRRRLTRRRRVNPWAVLAIVVVLAAAGVGTYLYMNRPQGLDAVDGAAVSAAGAFQAKENGDGIITVALEIRNVTDDPLTVLSARLVPPSGLTQLGVGLLAPDEQNSSLNLDAELPPLEPIALGTTGVERNGIVVARFQVTCEALPDVSAATGERIFVTIRLGEDQREEELIPPVYDGTSWLTATARGACLRPSINGEIPTPLPTL